MKYIPLIILAFLFIGAHVYLEQDIPISFKEATFANSQVDTVHYKVTAGLTALSFSAHFKDSVSVTSVSYRRVTNGEPMAAIAADTLANFAAYVNTAAGYRGTSANPSSARVNAVTLAPLPDEFWFIVTYASSGNGVTNGKVRYEVIGTVGK